MCRMHTRYILIQKNTIVNKTKTKAITLFLHSFHLFSRTWHKNPNMYNKMHNIYIEFVSRMQTLNTNSQLGKQQQAIQENVKGVQCAIQTNRRTQHMCVCV